MFSKKWIKFLFVPMVVGSFSVMKADAAIFILTPGIPTLVTFVPGQAHDCRCYRTTSTGAAYSIETLPKSSESPYTTYDTVIRASNGTTTLDDDSGTRLYDRATIYMSSSTSYYSFKIRPYSNSGSPFEAYVVCTKL